MTRVRDIMNHGVISCSGDTVIADVARKLVDSQIHGAFVVDSVGRHVGVIVTSISSPANGSAVMTRLYAQCGA